MQRKSLLLLLFHLTRTLTPFLGSLCVVDLNNKSNLASFEIRMYSSICSPSIEHRIYSFFFQWAFFFQYKTYIFFINSSDAFYRTIRPPASKTQSKAIYFATSNTILTTRDTVTGSEAINSDFHTIPCNFRNSNEKQRVILLLFSCVKFLSFYCFSRLYCIQYTADRFLRNVLLSQFHLSYTGRIIITQRHRWYFSSVFKKRICCFIDKCIYVVKRFGTVKKK